jgi:predicted Zn-ribbon and HTH transcriptional regulator
MDNDLNKIAGYEKAIKKKYGPEAVENPAKYWNEDKEKDYLDQLRHVAEKQRRANETSELVEVEGFLVNKKLLNREARTNCPVCAKKFKNIRDNIYNNKYECCQDCYIKHIEGREDRWLKGWRPDNVTSNN